MELLILLGFAAGWATCWIQESRYLHRMRDSMLEKESELKKQLHSHSETVVAQEMEILRAQEKALAQERELDSLRYRI
jgi:hypothetical protein